VWLWYREPTAWDWRRRLPGLVVLSCLLTSYGGWAFDLVVLLVPIVALAALISRSDRRSLALAAGAALLAVSALSFVMHARRVPQAAFLWMTPAVAIAWWTMRPRALPRGRRSGVGTDAGNAEWKGASNDRVRLRIQIREELREVSAMPCLNQRTCSGTGRR